MAFDVNNSFIDNCNYASTARLIASGDVAERDEETELQGFLLYPNPATNNEVFVLAEDNGIEALAIEVSNAGGLTVLKQNLEMQHNMGNFNLAQLANGVYIVSITNPKTNVRVIKKLVIQK